MNRAQQLSIKIIIYLVIAFATVIYLNSITEPDKQLISKAAKRYPFQTNYNTANKINEYNETSFSINSGDSIYLILQKLDVPQDKINKILLAIDDQNLRINLMQGKQYFVYKDEKDQICKITIELSYDEIFTIFMNNNSPTVNIQKVERKYSTALITSKIEGNLFDTCDKIGYGPSLAYQLNSIFLWDIDFNTEIQNGDSFTAIVDKYTYEDGTSKINRIKAARFVLRNKSYDAILFNTGDSSFSYFDPEGKSMKKPFLRSPLKFSRVSSKFSYKRFHPILRIYRPHLGVDYAAPSGSAVMATASGTVSYTGWDKKGGGNAIKINHKNGFQTIYMHLSKYAKRIKKGTQIKQGDIIGYVGSTGLSTGPHLDYRIVQNGIYLNPLKMKIAIVETIPSDIKQRYYQYRDKILELLDSKDLNQFK